MQTLSILYCLIIMENSSLLNLDDELMLTARQSLQTGK